MKFTYDDTDRYPRDVLAYIDIVGDLVFRRAFDDIEGVYNAVSLNVDTGEAITWRWEPDSEYNERRFYAGDTLTITF